MKKLLNYSNLITCNSLLPPLIKSHCKYFAALYLDSPVHNVAPTCQLSTVED